MSTSLSFWGDAQLEQPPEDLKNLHWCTWKWKWDAGRGKYVKPPYSPTGEKLSTNNPSKWCSYSEVEACDKKGFLLHREDGLCVVDVDNCRDPKTGEIAEWAWKIINALNSYTEASPSGEGVHIIGHGIKPEDARSRFHLEGHEVEVYDQNQYITYTGNVVELHYIIRNVQDWIDEYVPLAKGNLDQHTAITDEVLAREVPELELSDEDIVRKLSSFSYGEKFKELYSGHFEDYESHSEADLALCFYLAFMTKDEEQIDRIFRNSGLYRGKWERYEYRAWTIQKALDSNPGLYVPSVSMQTVEDLFSLRLRIAWKKYSLSYVYGALLCIAYKHSGVSDEGILVFAASRDIKLVSGLSISGTQLSTLIHKLEEMNLIKILEIGSPGKATEYLIYSSGHISNNLSNNLNLFTNTENTEICIPPNLCLMMWVQNELHLQYQKDLNPTQKAVIELSQQYRFSVEELATIMSMRKDNFKSRVLKGLERYVRVDRKGFVRPRKNLAKILEKNFDRKRYKDLREEIEDERSKYNHMMLIGPFQRYLREAEKTEENRSHVKANSGNRTLRIMNSL